MDAPFSLPEQYHDIQWGDPILFRHISGPSFGLSGEQGRTVWYFFTVYVCIFFCRHSCRTVAR
jgi:hypothetical protein